MGLIDRFFGLIFGGGGNPIVETAQVFRENAENAAGREVELRHATLAQFGAEFALPRKGLFDRFIDGLNRLPRPALALGTISLFVTAMIDPVWFAARMQGVALVPEPLWWLMGAIVSFYFGARHQAKSQDFRRSIASSFAMAPAVARQIEALETGATETETNAALDDWRSGRGK